MSEERISPLNVLLDAVPDLDLTIDGSESGPANDLLLPDFEISRLLTVIAFALDLNESEDKGFFSELELLPRADIIKRVNAILQFDVKSKDGKQRQIWTADMKKTGRIYKGKLDGVKPDVSLQCSDADLVSLAKGQASPQKMFLTGKLKVKGKLMVGLRMNDLLASEISKMSKL